MSSEAVWDEDKFHALAARLLVEDEEVCYALQALGGTVPEAGQEPGDRSVEQGGFGNA